MLTRTLIAFAMVLAATSAASALDPVELPVSSTVLLLSVLIVLAGATVVTVVWQYVSAIQQLSAQGRSGVSDVNAERAYEDPHG